MTGEDNKCGQCGRSRVFTTCLGCGTPMCEDCSRFELIGSGCGCVWPVYYCKTCVCDPSINPNALLRD